jgi:hypothetical protein
MGTHLEAVPPYPHDELNLFNNLISEKATILSYLELLQVNTFVTLNQHPRDREHCPCWCELSVFLSRKRWG